ncbi:predicted protein [Naegleria gruberi]|uniref:Predicted protein n=1 Tax=Naegleria gruberi TaxID=5762 RepID=D2VB73_NAEGR|nr:uncharacterized protein NAEGRDRAFT_66115 [Naegleria gruberi]EFC45858.1 predicted protein [Naegleria gruberi]|eukprot:XP_002678602.1 predicted protein [Naegleria gruberi strain NEG-M]
MNGFVYNSFLVICLLLLAVTFLFAEEKDFWNKPIQTRALVEQVNSQVGVGWRATSYPHFDNMKLSDFRKYLGVHNFTEPTRSKFNVRAELTKVRNLPEQFDARKEWPHCITPIRNQEQCGSCWAFSASAVLSDRFCVYSNGSVQVMLSPEYMLECSAQNNACNGGTLHAAWQFLVSVGIPTDSCVPYSSGNGTVGHCPSKCTVPGQTSKFYKAAAAKKLENMVEIMTEIKTHGSVQVAIAVYRDLFSYKSGVYHHVTWGLDGYFWILRGHNECGFGKDVWAGKPAL